MCPLKTIINTICLVCFCVQLSGCFFIATGPPPDWMVGDVGREPTVIPQKLNEIREAITNGSTTRTDMENMYGQPLTRNDSWRIDLFQVKYSDYSFHGPVWSPIIPLKKNEIIFIIVNYDNNWIVDEFDVGYVSEKAPRETREISRCEPAKSKHVILDFDRAFCTKFSGFFDSHVYLFTSSEITNDYINRKPVGDNCRLYLETPIDNVVLRLDGKTIYNIKYSPIETLFTFDIKPSKHRIEVKDYRDSWVNPENDGLIFDFECMQGDILQFSIDENDKDLDGSLNTERNIIVSEKSFLSKGYHRLVLYHNGIWFGPEKP